MDEEIVIDVRVDGDKAGDEIQALIKELDKLIQAQKNVSEARKAGKMTDAEAKIAQKELAEQIAFTTAKIEGLKKATESSIKTDKDYGDSLIGMRKKLSDMQKAYAGLSKAERESAKGKDFQRKIKEQHDAVLELEGSIGQMQRNVGNYAESMSKAFGGVGGTFANLSSKLGGIKQAFQGATGGAKGMTGALRVLQSLGIVALVVAIVEAVKKMIKVFKGSEERMAMVKKAFAPLQPIIDGIGRAFEWLADVLAGAFAKAIDGVVAGIRWLAEALDSLGEFLGFKWNLAESFKKASDEATKLSQLEEDYIKNKRKWVTEEANLERELAELRAKASDKDKYNAQERLKFLSQANDKELELLAGRKKLAEQNLQILKLNAERGQNDAEANDAIAEAEAEVVRQETEYLKKQRELLGQMKEARAQIRKEAEARTAEELKIMAEIEKAQEEEIEASIEAEANALKMELANADKAIKEIEDNWKKRKEALTKFGIIAEPTQLEKELELLADAYNAELLTYEEYLLAKSKLEDDANKKTKAEADKTAKDIANKWIEAENKMSSAIASGFSTLSSALEELNGANKEASDLQKALAYSAILLQEAQSIANGARAISEAVANAQQASAVYGPAAPAVSAGYTATMVANIVSVMASVTNAIVQAKKIFAESDSGKYAQGGIIDPYGSSLGGDNLIAHVNSREMIFNTSQQKRLYDIATGTTSAFNYQAFAQMISTAVANQPAPILTYKEFSDFQSRVTTINEIAKI